MIYPLGADLADEGVPFVLTCRVLGFSKQANLKWRAIPVSQRDGDDAHLINDAVDFVTTTPNLAAGSSPTNSSARAWWRPATA